MGIVERTASGFWTAEVWCGNGWRGLFAGGECNWDSPKAARWAVMREVLHIMVAEAARILRGTAP